MSSVSYLDYKTILEMIRTWPTAIRITLVQDVLRTVETDVVAPYSASGTLARASGLLATGDRPPTDEEVERILEEERIKKYG